MHDNLIGAALFAQRHTDKGRLENFRIKDNGAYFLLTYDVVKGDDNIDPLKIGEVWVGGDRPGGISGYLNDGLEDGNPFDSLRITEGPWAPDAEVRGTRILGLDLVEMVEKMVAATEHKVTLTGFHLGMHDIPTVWEFKIQGRDQTFTADQHGEIFNEYGTPTTPTYPDGEDATEDLMNLTGRFMEEYRKAWAALAVDARLEAVADLALKAVSND